MEQSIRRGLATGSPISVICFDYGYRTIDHLDIETIHHGNSQTHLYRLRVRQAVTKTRFVFAKVLNIPGFSQLALNRFSKLFPLKVPESVNNMTINSDLIQ